MKSAVVLDEIREEDLIPKEIFLNYLDVLAREIPRYFPEGAGALVARCPACASENLEEAFEKISFRYRRCRDCGSLFARERPADEAIRKYFKESESHRILIERLLAAREAMREDILFRPRVEWLVDSAVGWDAPRDSFLEVRAKYPSLLRLIGEEKFFGRVMAVGPLFDPAKAGAPGLEVRARLSEIPAGSVSVLAAFEHIDRLFDVNGFLDEAMRILAPKGLLAVTTTNASGFDIQVLGPAAGAFQPPQRVTILSLEGLLALFRRHGFEVRETSTPGQLDLENVKNALAKDPALVLPPFVAYLLRHRDETAHEHFKEFLQRNRLSSHTRLVLQKS